MINNKLKTFLIFLISPFLLASCGEEYFSHNSGDENKIQAESKYSEESKNFSVDKIEDRELELFSSPDKTIIDKIIAKIDASKNRVYLETYIFTEKRILKSILDAKKRGVEVKVILEKNVLGSGNINSKIFESLKAVGADIRYASGKNYRFTHSKFFLIDQEYIIQTGNVSYSTYTQNKEFFVFGKNQEDIKNLDMIFSKDLIGEKFIFCDETLIISPICPRNEIIKTLKSANKNILIFNQSLEDIEIINLLEEKKKAGVDIRLFIGDIEKVKSNKDTYEKFLKLGITIKAPKKPYIHAKAFLVDEKILFIGSINFTSNSIDNNREVGILFKNNGLSIYFKNEFERLFDNMQ